MKYARWLPPGSWWAVFLWVVLFASFLLFFPLYQKGQRKPAMVFLFFMSSFSFEMFGIPLSSYLFEFILAGPFSALPLRWGVLREFIGMGGHYVFLSCVLAGGTLVVCGWAAIYRDFWSGEDGTGLLVSSGLYRIIRHPQYAGLLLVSLGTLFERATLVTVVLYPVLVAMYRGLALQEEEDLAANFGERWVSYSRDTVFFFPRPACLFRK